MSVTALVLASILLVSVAQFEDAFADDDKKEKVKEKIKEKVEKIKEKIKEKKDKIKEKKDKIKEKIKKIKDKIQEHKDKKSKKSDSQDDSETIPEIEEIVPEASNNEEETLDEILDEPLENEQIPQIQNIVVDSKSKMNKFKGSGNDYAPTFGSDRYGNNYVDNGFSFNDFVTDVEGFKTHMPLQTLQVGEKNSVTMKIYENRGANKIEHVELAFGLDYDEYATQSENRIIWEQNFKGDQTITEYDPKNNLMDVNAVATVNGKILEITFDFAFRAPMAKSQIGVIVWDQERHSRTVYFNDGIEVVGESLNPPEVVTILDEKGYPVTITMTGENEGVDEEGNIWTHNSPWKKQSVLSENLEDEKPELVGGHGFDRNHNMFEKYQKSQEQSAQEKLIQILGGNNIYNFSD